MIVHTKVELLELGVLGNITDHILKTNLSVENYLLLHIPCRSRVALAKCRVGIHDFEIERGRYAKVPANERFCKLCLTLNENHIDDEYHVLLKCPFYKDFRKIYPCFNNDPLNLHTFVNIMCTQSQEEIVQLACFISSMFKLRYCYLYSVWWVSPKLNYVYDVVWWAGGLYVHLK